MTWRSAAPDLPMTCQKEHLFPDPRGWRVTETMDKGNGCSWSRTARSFLLSDENIAAFT